MKLMHSVLSKKNIEFLYKILLFLIIALGLYFRLKLYFRGDYFWYDELNLGINLLNRNFLEMFSPFDNILVSPPLLMCLYYIIGKLSNYNEQILKLPSIISGCLSLLLFFPLPKLMLISSMLIFSLRFTFASAGVVL